MDKKEGIFSGVVEIHKQATVIQFLFIAIGWTLNILGPFLEEQYGLLAKTFVESKGYFYPENFVDTNAFVFAVIFLFHGYMGAYGETIKNKNKKTSEKA